MDTEVTENNNKNNETPEEKYIEIEIPHQLFEFLSSENYDIQNICRICLSVNSEMLFPLVSSTEESLLANMYMAVTNTWPSPEDELPSSICEQCQSLLALYYEFKVKCERSELMLKSIPKRGFILKEELSENMCEVPGDKDTDEPKEETNIVEDVEYLESLRDNDINDKEQLLIVRKSTKRRSLKKNKGSHNNAFSVKKWLEKKAKSYVCVHCSKVFSKTHSLQIHANKVHGIKFEKRPHPCKHCKESFDSEHDLTVHSALHTKGTSWKCNQCLKPFNNKTALRRHVQRHMQSKPHVCATCHKSFTERYALRRHVRVHTGERVEKKYNCHICDNRYAESRQLAAHVARHTDTRPHACATCHKRFPSTRLLASHMLVHSDSKPYACSFCDKRFRHESTRNTHHRTHTGEKPYVCTACGKSFIQNSNLTLHMRTHTGERPYSCSKCERKFTSGSSLKCHLRIHTGERPYTCKVCGKSFARMNLSTHMRQHTGERPHACSACPKTFVNASRLREHCRIHTGEKPYECAYCSCRFSTKGLIGKHIRSHEQQQKKSLLKQRLLKQQSNNTQSDENLRFVTVTQTIEENIIKNCIKLELIHEIPLEVSGELILQDDSNTKTELLVVDNSRSDYPISNNDVCLSSVNVININE